MAGDRDKAETVDHMARRMASEASELAKIVASSVKALSDHVTTVAANIEGVRLDIGSMRTENRQQHESNASMMKSELSVVHQRISTVATKQDENSAARQSENKTTQDAVAALSTTVARNRDLANQGDKAIVDGNRKIIDRIKNWTIIVLAGIALAYLGEKTGVHIAIPGLG